MIYADYINEAIRNEKAPKKAVFLDRDGTINVDKVNTVRVADLEYLPGVIESLKSFVDNGYILVIVSNQDGVRKGMYGPEDMHIFNMKIINDLKEHGIEVAGVYYSPYSKADNHYSFKPNPGMLLDAIADFNIDPKESFFIGDQMSDVIAGLNSGVQPLLVTTGIYKTPLENDPAYLKYRPTTFKYISDCVPLIIGD